jgi:hypothetical protein
MNNITSFRASVPTATTAAAPVSIVLASVSQAIQRFTIFANAAPDLSKCGYRLKHGSGILIPEAGGAESGITLLAAEAGWAPFSNIDLDFPMGGRSISGPPFEVTIDLFKTTGAALLVGGYLITCQPKLEIEDLILEIRKWQEKRIAPIEYDREVVAGPGSTRPPYPTQEKRK